MILPFLQRKKYYVNALVYRMRIINHINIFKMFICYGKASQILVHRLSNYVKITKSARFIKIQASEETFLCLFFCINDILKCKIRD